MSSSAVSHALEDVLEAVDEEVTVDSLRDDHVALFDNARAVLEEYKGAAGEDAQRLADHVRGYLARVLQFVNQELPELMGTTEVLHATEVLSNPHLQAVNTSAGTIPTVANDPGATPETPVDPGTMANAPDSLEDEEPAKPKAAGRPRKEDK